MDLKQSKSKLVGSEDERAVSPVIGVILMVAITVILAAVIAAFVLDIGDLDDSAPNAQFDWESNSDNDLVNVSHTSGDDIDLGDITVQVDTNDGSDEATLVSDDFTAGDTIEFEIDGDDEPSIADGASKDEGFDDVDGASEYEEITLVWESDGTSTVITSHEPN